MTPNDSPSSDSAPPPAKAAGSDNVPAGAGAASDRLLAQLRDQVAKRQGELDSAKKRLAEYEKQKRDRERKAEAKLAGRVGAIWIKMGLTPADAEAFLKAHKGKIADAVRQAIGVTGPAGGAP